MKKARKKESKNTLKTLKKSNKNQKLNKEIAIVAYIFVGLFICMMGYFVYYNVYVSPTVITSSYNTRQDLFAKYVQRGKIISSDNQVLAETLVDEDGNEKRVYPYNNIFSHVVGHSTKGKAGIESIFNFNLLHSHAFPVERLVNSFKGEKNIGDNLITTLDTSIQEVAYDALGNYNGAVVVMEAQTGKILTMVSKPDYNPNDIDIIWDSLINADSEESVLINRATQGLYPPGSTFKILTLLEYIKENPDTYSDYVYDCSGSITLDDSTINCYHNTVHGSEDIYTSFAKSCNSSFANLGLNLNISSLTKLCNSFLFNSSLPYSYVHSKSSFSLSSDAPIDDIMQTMIGQGETLVSPLQMALIMSTIANDGVMMKPYLVDRIENYEGNIVKEYKSSEYSQIITEDEASIMQDFLSKVVSDGTASKLKTDEYNAYGKTGSAEYTTDKSKSHAWFVGYANEGEGSNDIVVSIIVEEAGAGSEYAVPIAKKIFDAYYCK